MNQAILALPAARHPRLALVAEKLAATNLSVDAAAEILSAAATAAGLSTFAGKGQVATADRKMSASEYQRGVAAIVHGKILGAQK